MKPPIDISSDHHYVPVWYQRRFLPGGDGEFFVLDKNPITSLKCADGAIRQIRPKDVLRRGPYALFQEKGLYSVALRGVRVDAIERYVFGKVDDEGKELLDVFGDWPKANGLFIKDDAFTFPPGFGHPTLRMMNLTEFMDIQKLRTPRGLAQIRTRLAQIGAIAGDNNRVINLMLGRRRINCTVWTEAYWEMFSVEPDSPSHFLLSDEPVTLYNMDCFPASPICAFPNDPHAFWRGTRVLYPLSPNRLLVLSHKEHMDDPRRSKARQDRRNARSFGESIASYTHIKNSRTLKPEDVAKVNYILRARASRFVASANRDDLFPEAVVGTPYWPDLDTIFHSEYPSFMTGEKVMVRYEDGTILHENAFGERDVVPGWFVRQQEAKRPKGRG
jgi:hypothetical protein